MLRKFSVGIAVAACVALCSANLQAQCVGCSGSTPVYSTPVATGYQTAQPMSYSYAPAMPYAPATYGAPVQQFQSYPAQSFPSYQQAPMTSGCGCSGESGIVSGGPIDSGVVMSNAMPAMDQTFTGATAYPTAYPTAESTPISTGCCGSAAAVSYVPQQGCGGCGGCSTMANHWPFANAAAPQVINYAPQGCGCGPAYNCGCGGGAVMTSAPIIDSGCGGCGGCGGTVINGATMIDGGTVIDGGAMSGDVIIDGGVVEPQEGGTTTEQATPPTPVESGNSEKSPTPATEASGENQDPTKAAAEAVEKAAGKAAEKAKTN